MTILVFRPSFEACPLFWSVALVLHEKGLPYDTTTVPMGEPPSAALRAVNPRGFAPCLKDGDAVAYETVAQMQYLEFAYPDPELMPSEPGARAGRDASRMRRGSRATVSASSTPPCFPTSHGVDQGVGLEPNLAAWQLRRAASWNRRADASIGPRHGMGSDPSGW